MRTCSSDMQPGAAHELQPPEHAAEQLGLDDADEQHCSVYLRQCGGAAPGAALCARELQRSLVCSCTTCASSERRKRAPLQLLAPA